MRLALFLRRVYPRPPETEGSGHASSTDGNGHDHRAGSASERSDGNQRGKPVGMKTYCRGLTINRAIVEEAYREWCEAPAGKKNAWRVPQEHGSAAELVDEVTREIAERRLEFEPIHRYDHIEPTNGKVRTIGVSSVKQQLVDYVVVHCCSDFLNARIGHYQASSVKGKGATFTMRTIRRWVKEGDARFFIKMDVRKCYPSTSHDVVMRIFRKYIASPDVLYCIEMLLATYTGGGLEIGSYFSLRAEQLVLSFAYHHIESLHKERRGRKRALVAHQLWYMDDALLMGNDKRDLKAAARSLQNYMKRELGLELKPWKVCRVGEDEPIDMAGYAVRPSHVEVRAGTFIRGMRAFRRFKRKPCLRRARRVTSYMGYFKHADCDGLIERNDMHATMRAARRYVSRSAHAANSIGYTARSR